MTPPDSSRKPHHRGGRFQNNYVEFTARSLAEVLRWKREARRNGLPPPPREPIPQAPADLDFLAANARAGSAMVPAMTWVGHATVLAQLGGLSMLTDPIFSLRASPLGFAGPLRHQPPGVALVDLPHIDLVVVSHNHYDHLDSASVRALARQAGGPPLFVVPLGLAAWFRGLGIANVVELDWWQAHQLGNVEIVLVPAQHWSARGLNDRMKTLWGAWSVFAGDLRWYFSGDAGYSSHFADVREQFASRARDGLVFDLALLSIGAYEPRWFMREQHMNPADAVQAHKDLGARRSMGIHWGTFQLTDEALDQPPIDLAVARQEQRVPEQDFFVLPIAGTHWPAGAPGPDPKQ